MIATATTTATTPTNTANTMNAAAAAMPSVGEKDDESSSPNGVIDEEWMIEAEEQSSSSSIYSSCRPGRAAAKRLRRFDESWGPDKSISNLRLQHLGEEDIMLDRILGHGSWSTAYRVFLRDSDSGQFDSDQSFALKRLKPEINAAKKTSPELSQTASSDLALETKILANLQHENIISLHGVKQGDMIESLNEGSFFIVIDLLLETLDVRLERWAQKKQKRKSLFSLRGEIALTRRFQDVAMGIVKAMEYLHDKNIMFRDLKPANIGFDYRGTVKIFDFGLSREYNEDEEGQPLVKPRLMTGGAGTPRYMAPEVAKMEDSYGFPADVYSFTILLWQIATNRVPFASITSPTLFNAKVVQGGKRPRLKLIKSPHLQRLLEAGWSSNPDDRPTFAVIHRTLQTIIQQRPSYRRLNGLDGSVHSHASSVGSNRSRKRSKLSKYGGGRSIPLATLIKKAASSKTRRKALSLKNSNSTRETAISTTQSLSEGRPCMPTANQGSQDTLVTTDGSALEQQPALRRGRKPKTVVREGPRRRSPPSNSSMATMPTRRPLVASTTMMHEDSQASSQQQQEQCRRMSASSFHSNGNNSNPTPAQATRRASSSGRIREGRATPLILAARKKKAESERILAKEAKSNDRKERKLRKRRLSNTMLASRSNSAVGSSYSNL